MERIVYEPSWRMPENGTTFCAGCSHGTALKLIARAIDKYELPDETIICFPVGCAAYAGIRRFFNSNSLSCAHGRASAVATAVKACSPDSLVCAYQGDGDLASIGMCETIHAANRGANITVIFVNNVIFGMTGGQMAPTTMLGQWSTTTQNGRDIHLHGNTMNMAELIASFDTAKYVARASLHDAKHVAVAQKYIMRAFQTQHDDKGYSFVELLSCCPTNWKLTPQKCVQHVENVMLPRFPLGEFKTI